MGEGVREGFTGEGKKTGDAEYAEERRKFGSMFGRSAGGGGKWKLVGDDRDGAGRGRGGGGMAEEIGEI